MIDEVCLAKGQVDRLGSSSPNLVYERHDGVTYQTDVPPMEYEAVFHSIFATLLDTEKGILQNLSNIAAVGHRVVHGGSRFAESALITPEVETAINDCISLAPLHNPYNLGGIRACRQVLPNAAHAAVFDTAFHQTMPNYAYMYALPRSLYEQYDIRRYGFHGTSHRYVSMRAAEILGRPLTSLKLITCHLGNGCSITAVDRGKSVDTSMGLTPLEGLMMGTRCGDIDPAIIFHLMEEGQMSADTINQMLNRESGLLGVSGVASDVRDLFQAVSEGNPQAALALKMFSYRVRQYIGKYAAVLGGLDALIFTAGIGENAPSIRATICENLGFLGIHLDEEKNQSSGVEKPIHREDAPVKLLVIPTNEELMIARDTLRLIEG
jgi:acetate kinase